jgi:putative endopeptidase
MGFPAQRFYVVRQPTALTGEAALFGETPLPVLKDYYALRVLKGAAPLLSRAFDQANFQFTGTVLSGVPQQEPRWKRAVGAVSGALGETVGIDYVARYFPPDAKAQADDLVRNVRAAMADRLKGTGKTRRLHAEDRLS